VAHYGIADWPDRPIHGYRISQLFSSTVDPGEILREYRTTRFPDRFYNLKIGLAWADLERRLDVAAVLRLCGSEPLLDRLETGSCAVGIDTGKELHVVVLRQAGTGDDPPQLVHLGVYAEFSDLDGLFQRFPIERCVIDGLPETHATREFAQRHRGLVYMNFFNESQRGAAKWDPEAQTVQINRTEALDASRTAVRAQALVLPHRSERVEEFARHLAADAKVLEEDEETGIKKYRYVRTGTNHFSLAFTYAWMAKGELVGMPEIWVPEVARESYPWDDVPSCWGGRTFS